MGEYFKFMIKFLFYYYLIPIYFCNKCIVDEKYECHGQTDESKCINSGCCWDSNSSPTCFYGNDNLPGFVLTVGRGDSVHISLSIQNTSELLCSRICLEKSDCSCFTFDKNTKNCSLKNRPCLNADGTTLNIRNFNKIAAPGLSCARTLCPDFGYKASGADDITAHNLNFLECVNKCKSHASCKLFTYTFKKNVRLTSLCFIKAENCRFKEYLHAMDTSCAKVPLFPHTNEFFHDDIKKMIDSEAENTCISVLTEKDFLLRVPWPLVNTPNRQFRIQIKGHNLQKCIDPLTGLQEAGVLAYVPIKTQIEPIFKGPFKACIFESGNDTTECVYSCSCGEDYCQAVYIRAFGGTTDNIDICHYNIL